MQDDGGLSIMANVVWFGIVALNLVDRSCAAGKFIGWNPQTLQHRDKQVSQRNILMRDVFLPWFNAAVPRTGLRILAGPIQILPVAKAHRRAARQNQRVISRKMEGAGR